MIKKILIIFILIIGLVSSYVAMQASEFKISREITINADAAKIFPYVNESLKLQQWMPWQDQDPNVKMMYSGPTEGLGAKSSWTSTGQMGVGEAVIIESQLNELVKTQLTYTKPMEMSQIATISLKNSGQQATLVTWTVTGRNTFIGRFMCLFFDMDKLVGTQFEKGLNNLKSIIEKPL